MTVDVLFMTDRPRLSVRDANEYYVPATASCTLLMMAGWQVCARALTYLSSSPVRH